MNTAFNIVGLHNDSVFNDIRTFINSFTSKHTQSTYERNIRTFFMWYANNQLEHLTEDMLPIKYAKFVEYQTHLRALEYSNSTINNMISAVQSLYKFLEKNEYKVKASNLVIKSLVENTTHAGSLFGDEAESMAKAVLKQRKGVEKAALIRLAYTTSLRKSTLLSISFDDITPRGTYYIIKVITKGGTFHEVSIPKEIYEELLKIKEQPYYKQYQDNLVFHLRNKAIQDMMDSLRGELEIPKHRNIQFHSFRNVAVKYGTLEEAQEQLGHSNINTTKVSYDNETKDLSDRPSMRMHNQLPDNIFDSLSNNELIKIILSEDSNVLMRLKMKANEIIKQKEMESC